MLNFSRRAGRSALPALPGRFPFSRLQRDEGLPGFLLLCAARRIEGRREITVTGLMPVQLWAVGRVGGQSGGRGGDRGIDGLIQG